MSELDDRVWRAWTATAWLHEPLPPASPDELDSVEQSVGRPLPGAFRALYQRHDGGSWLGSDLVLMSLQTGGELSVAQSSATHREWD
jgi:cell wall assembly regulator SMI1